MSARYSGSRRTAVLLSSLLVGSVSAGAGSSAESQYLAENHAAMTKMMAAMATQRSGDVDRDFVAVMIPHHQGAIEMAQAELRYGRNEHLRRLAQEIIIDQTQEIAAMRLALGQPLPPSAPAPDQITGGAAEPHR